MTNICICMQYKYDPKVKTVGMNGQVTEVKQSRPWLDKLGKFASSVEFQKKTQMTVLSSSKMGPIWKPERITHVLQKDMGHERY